MKLPYKTSVISDEIAQDVVIASDTAAEYHLDALEIRGAWGKGPHDLAAGDITTYPGKLKLIVTGAGEAAMAVCTAKMRCDPKASYFPGHSSGSATFEPGAAH